MMSSSPNDFDSPWKEVLEAYFEECMAFFFSDVHSDINWSKGYEFLDKELQQVVREAEIGKRVADKLVKVWKITGEQVWVLVHIEVQSQSERHFAERMYTYNYRLRDRFDRPVASFALLSDDTLSWRPKQFNAELWGCTIDFTFRTAKLLDYKERWDELFNSDNPFAVVVMAHLKTLETTGDRINRKQWKLILIKLLYQRGYSRENVIRLFRFIDWLLVLPADLESSVWEDILTYQEELKMPYMMSFERAAMAKGREEGREEGLIQGLKLAIQLSLKSKFGAEGLKLHADLEHISDIETLTSLQEMLCENASVSDIRTRYLP